VIAEGLHDLLIGELQQLVALFDQRDADTEDGEHAGVFDADDAAANHDQCPGQLGHIQDLIAVDDGGAVDGHLVRRGRLGAHGYDHAAGVEGGVGLRAFDAKRLRGDEVRHAVDDVDSIAGELGFGDVDLGFDHTLDAEGQVGHGDLFLDPVVHAVDGAVVVAGKVQHGFAHGFGRNGAGVDANPADNRPCFDDGYLLLQLGGCNGGALPRRSGADNNQVILDGAHAIIPQGRKRLIFKRLSTPGG
jgi:hypothetical protein